jgi:GxxExxY protein
MAFLGTPVSRQVIGCAMKVHRAIGPGLFESVYQQCLVHELADAGLAFKTQVPLRLTYGAVQLACVFRADLIVEDQLLVELKTVDQFHPVHDAQVLTYLRLSGVRQGLLINFNAKLLKDGIKSFLMGQPDIDTSEAAEQERPRDTLDIEKPGTCSSS